MEQDLFAKIAFSVAACALGVFILSLVAGFGTQNNYGYLSGTVKIGPFCPPGSANQTCTPANLYSSRDLVLTSENRFPLFVALQSDGRFSQRIEPGIYSLGLTNCTFPGCAVQFPKNLTITSGKIVVLNISISTDVS